MLGYYGLLPGFDDFTYRYYIPGIVGNTKCCSAITNIGACDRIDSKCCISEIPTINAFPYTIGCFKGCTIG